MIALASKDRFQTLLYKNIVVGYNKITLLVFKWQHFELFTKVQQLYQSELKTQIETMWLPQVQLFSNDPGQELPPKEDPHGFRAQW